MARQLDRSILQGVDIFRDLDDAALDDVLLSAQRRRIAAGETVFRQGDMARAFYVLVEGRLKVAQVTPEGQQVVVRFIGPNEMFGCVAVSGGTVYPGTATAVVDSLAIGWHRDMTERLMDRHPRIARNALGTVGDRLQETQARVRELSTERVERRIAHALVRLGAQAGKPVQNGVEIEFPITRQDIAEMTGTTLHTVSRTLSDWEGRQIVQGGRQRIVIRDAAALLKIAEEL